MYETRGESVTNHAAIDTLVNAARARLDRVAITDLAREQQAGALVVDVRPVEQRHRDGDLPGAVVIDLEWRLDPSCSHRLPEATDANRKIIVVCNEGTAPASPPPRCATSASTARLTSSAATRPGSHTTNPQRTHRRDEIHPTPACGIPSFGSEGSFRAGTPPLARRRERERKGGTSQQSGAQ
jgi:hypothetical protein